MKQCVRAATASRVDRQSILRGQKDFVYAGSHGLHFRQAP